MVVCCRSKVLQNAPQSILHCILQYFRPALSDYQSWKSFSWVFFWLAVSDRFDCIFRISDQLYYQPAQLLRLVRSTVFWIQELKTFFLGRHQKCWSDLANTKWASFWENQVFAYEETKPQISCAVTAQLICGFVFHYMDRTIPLLPKSEISNL